MQFSVLLVSALLPVLAEGSAPTAPHVLYAEQPASGTAAIYRDEWGMPHIYASEESDGYFSLGYATAMQRKQP